MPPTNLTAPPTETRPWTESDIATMRDRLKLGSRLIDIAEALGRHPEEIAAQIRHPQATPLAPNGVMRGCVS
jgi:hypothetical protein